ncbi:MAG: NifB/NifX family molybdenum-iron cluster-binding protein [Chloroflexi bacterium]|nr:NifB/NifX family molybdenum-iron cluster-binding protein [Chloroflexota bacterium]
MKIAAVSDDGITISQHFGRAMFYVVSTVEDGKVVSKEKRPKAGHHTFAAQEQHAAAAGEPHGYDAASQAKHRSMADAITDCQVLLAGGMGWGAYESMKSYNVEPFVTDVGDIDEAVQLYIAGRLPNLMDRVH